MQIFAAFDFSTWTFFILRCTEWPAYSQPLVWCFRELEHQVFFHLRRSSANDVFLRFSSIELLFFLGGGYSALLSINSIWPSNRCHNQHPGALCRLPDSLWTIFWWPLTTLSLHASDLSKYSKENPALLCGESLLSQWYRSTAVYQRLTIKSLK